MIVIVFMAILSIFFAYLALCSYKIHIINKSCTKATEGLLTDLKYKGGLKTVALVGKLSYKTEKGKSFHVNYEKGRFDKLPIPFMGLNSLSKPIEVTVMYNPKCPGIYYIKDSGEGFGAVIILSIFSLIFLSLAGYLFVLSYL